MNGDIKSNAESTVHSLLNFTKFASQFSRWVSMVLLFCWVGSLIASWITFFTINIYPVEVLEFVKEPMLIVLGFYYGTKMVENVSKGICEYMYKKLEVGNIQMESSGNVNTANDNDIKEEVVE